MITPYRRHCSSVTENIKKHFSGHPSLYEPNLIRFPSSLNNPCDQQTKLTKKNFPYPKCTVCRIIMKKGEKKNRPNEIILINK